MLKLDPTPYFEQVGTWTELKSNSPTPPPFPPPPYSQKYLVNAGVSQGSILGPTLFLLNTNDLPDDANFCNIAICADDTSVYSKCDPASDLLQQIELASELESDLRDIVDRRKKWLVDFNAAKTELVSFYLSNNTGAIDVKLDGTVPGEKSSFNMLTANYTYTHSERASFICQLRVYS